MSRPTTRSPNPRLNTISAIEPYRLMGRMRLASVTVTSRPSADATVTGSTGVGAGSSGSTVLSTVAVAGPQPAVSPDSMGPGVTPAAGDPGGVVGEPVGAPEPPAANATGTNTSAERSSPRIWSARVTTAQAMTRQSKPSAIAAATVIVTSKEPPGPNGVVRPVANTGGWDEIQTVLPPDPARSMPPPQGVGFCPGGGRTQNET